ncbi:MAG: sugar phosphate isomerase/epimerase [Thermoprotei archaeon]|nr:MAG: sugar phosphate isomerase/epimerase [Thermoprotei archaeon]
MKVSITIYSYARYFREGRATVREFIDFAASLGVEGVDLGYFWRDRGEMEEAKRLLRDKGLELACYITSNDFAQPEAERRAEQVDKVKRAVDDAEFMGVSKLRVFAGDLKEGIDYGVARDWVIDSLREVSKYAEEKGIVLALENHGRLFGKWSQILDLLEAVNSPYLKVNFDIGNFLLVGDDPIEAAEKLREHIVHVHVKDFEKRGDRFIGCTIGEGVVDVKGVIKRLHDLGYDGYLSIEYEGYEDNKIGISKGVRYVKSVLKEL